VRGPHARPRKSPMTCSRRSTLSSTTTAASASMVLTQSPCRRPLRRAAAGPTPRLLRFRPRSSSGSRALMRRCQPAAKAVLARRKSDRKARPLKGSNRLLRPRPRSPHLPTAERGAKRFLAVLSQWLFLSCGMYHAMQRPHQSPELATTNIKLSNKQSKINPPRPIPKKRSNVLP
jgi:hypothetical protein